jgi:hypothetical protein
MRFGGAARGSHEADYAAHTLADAVCLAVGDEDGGASPPPPPLTATPPRTEMRHCPSLIGPHPLVAAHDSSSGLPARGDATHKVTRAVCAGRHHGVAVGRRRFGALSEEWHACR